MSAPSAAKSSTDAAIEAIRRGYTPVAVRAGVKTPFMAGWGNHRWKDEDEVRAAFEKWNAEGVTNIGLLLGEGSGGLVDVDLDHPKTLRLRDYFLPPTPMQTGRSGRPRSHRWYVVKDNPPAYRKYVMPDGSTSVELRISGVGGAGAHQTVIPPSIWTDRHDRNHQERYRWEGTPWGGTRGPAVIDGRVLAVQVALLGLGAVLLDGWPSSGSRHDAYLALAGGLLRYGDDVHPWWERNLPTLIAALAEASGDEDGPETRVHETMTTTVKRLKAGERAIGFPKLAEIIGNEHAESVRRMAKEIASLAGFADQSMTRVMDQGLEEVVQSTLAPEEGVRDPMNERVSSWAAVDKEPYLTGMYTMPEPSVMHRVDGKALMYQGMVNSLFGLSESGKSWIALTTCAQEMAKGDRVLYIDMEDDPASLIDRMRRVGVGDDDMRSNFEYVHPEGPLADMQRYRFGNQQTEEGKNNAAAFLALVESFDPTLMVLDGLNMLYGLHGHDTNEATATSVVFSWLHKMTRGRRTTVLVIDHTGKGGGSGSSPIGAHQKIAQVRGTAIRADVVTRPMPGFAGGEVRLVVFKDSPGAVRAVSTRNGSEQVCGYVKIDSGIPGVTKVTIEPPAPDAVLIGATPGQEKELERLAKADELSELVLSLFEDDVNKTVTTPQAINALLELNHRIDGDTMRATWRSLVQRDLVIREGATNKTRYRLVADSNGVVRD